MTTGLLSPIKDTPYISSIVPGRVGVSSTNLQSITKDNWTSVTDPAVTDDSDSDYSVGSQWINTATDTVYVCTDVSVGAAVWKVVSASSSAVITAANDFAEDRLITVGSTLSELEGEEKLTFDGSTFTCTGILAISGMGSSEVGLTVTGPATPSVNYFTVATNGDAELLGVTSLGNVQIPGGDLKVNGSGAPGNNLEVVAQGNGYGISVSQSGNTRCVLSANGSNGGALDLRDNSGNQDVYISAVLRSYIKGNDLCIGTTTGTTAGGGKVLVFADNAGDPTLGSNTAGIYGKDVAGTVEMFAVDEAGNTTQLSPHDETGEWVFDSQNTKTGRRLKVRMEALIKRLVDKYPEDFAEFLIEG